MNKRSHVELLNEVFPNWGDESFYSWKYQNPFGMPICIEELDESKKLVSLRMFMPWEMESNGIKIKCYQPTDSATKDIYRGKGLFTKLTKKAIQALPADCFLFNFPNEKSVSTYIKLGWRLEAKKKASILPLYNISVKDKVDILINEDRKVLSTKWNDNRLNWRMGNNKEYSSITIDGKIIVYRTVNIKGFKTADLLNSDDNIDIKDVKKLFKALRVKGYILIRYIGFNTKLDYILSNCFLLKFKLGRDVNFVSYNLPSDYEIRLEMLDADYI